MNACIKLSLILGLYVIDWMQCLEDWPQTIQIGNFTLFYLSIKICTHIKRLIEEKMNTNFLIDLKNVMGQRNYQVFYEYNKFQPNRFIIKK
ncbi:hypothetical protein BpHYR1_008531 [Brachionus plicatilis]|uniref:Uncharacterized protein n=1 Tax=Brachionus plicatilis TaxID=10195 RepID=A0A3M7T5B7_BRAPC|nr:hypothetical protein BpHYR1_008531 [Brachionus plicatilis]